MHARETEMVLGSVDWNVGDLFVINDDVNIGANDILFNFANNDVGEQSIWLNVAPQEENLLTYDVNQNVGKNRTEQDEGILDDLLKALE